MKLISYLAALACVLVSGQEMISAQPSISKPTVTVATGKLSGGLTPSGGVGRGISHCHQSDTMYTSGLLAGYY